MPHSSTISFTVIWFSGRSPSCRRKVSLMALLVKFGMYGAPFLVFLLDSIA